MISVVLPVVLTVIPSMVPASEIQNIGFDTLIQNLPATVHEQLAGMTEIQVMIYITGLYFFAPNVKTFASSSIAIGGSKS